jgi:hypothetical protein
MKTVVSSIIFVYFLYTFWGFGWTFAGVYSNFTRGGVLQASDRAPVGQCPASVSLTVSPCIVHRHAM